MSLRVHRALTVTATPPFDYQYPSSPRTRHSQLLIFGRSNVLSFFRPPPFCLGRAALPFQHTYPEFLRTTNELRNGLRSLFTNKSESFCSFSGGRGSAPSLGLSAPTKDRIRAYPAILSELAIG